MRSNHQPSTNQTPPPQQPEGSASQNQNSRLTEQEQIKLSETYATFIASKKIGSGKHFPNKPPATWPISDDVSTHDLILAMRKFKFWGENHDTPHLASAASRIAKGARKQFTGHNTCQSWSGPANPVLVQPYGGQGWMFHGQATEAERLRQQQQKPQQQKQQPPARPPVLDPNIARDALRQVEIINRDLDHAKNVARLERAFRKTPRRNP